jgi:hypothetical protein
VTYFQQGKEHFEEKGAAGFTSALQALNIEDAAEFYEGYLMATFDNVMTTLRKRIANYPRPVQGMIVEDIGKLLDDYDTRLGFPPNDDPEART